jgi:hypothetical protein
MSPRYSFLCRKSNGQIWRVGRDIWGLCSAWNHATNPSLPMFDYEHKRSIQYARAIRNRMKAQGRIANEDYKELSNGMLWPCLRKPKD